MFGGTSTQRMCAPRLRTANTVCFISSFFHRIESGRTPSLGNTPGLGGAPSGTATGRHRRDTSSRRCMSRPDGDCQRTTTAPRPGSAPPKTFFLQCGSGQTSLLETPRGVGVRRSTLQPGGIGGTPLCGGACHGQMGTVSGPPRRYDRHGAAPPTRNRCEVLTAWSHSTATPRRPDGDSSPHVWRARRTTRPSPFLSLPDLPDLC